MNYSIGLDIGVASVGWACITPDYKILKHNNRFALGVHEFESAMVAADRRVQRGTRRRYNRRKKRIQLLQQLFEGEMKGLDPTFFAQYNNEHFWHNDNDFENRSLPELLNSMKINSKIYPTMYHLRNDLIATDEKMDLRFIYLALHHLVKYRGNFLNENLKWQGESNTLDLTSQLEYIFEQAKRIKELNIPSLTATELKAVQGLLLDSKVRKSDRLKELKSKYGKELEAVYTLLLGLKTSAEKLFTASENIERYKQEKIKLQISAEDFEQQLELLTDEERLFLEELQPIYQQTILHDLLQGSSCVSQAKVRQYEQFALQLADLKYLIDEYTNEKTYRKLFITPKKIMKQHTQEKPCLDKLSLLDRYIRSKDVEPFKNEVKNQLNGILKAVGDQMPKADKEKCNELAIAAENELLLVKLRSIHNVAIPNQNNVYEVQQILRKQQPHYAFITEEFINKVVQIISFRIPYYIGPLGDSEFSWLERVKEENITPFNFDEVVNQPATAANFIERMKNACTYLKSESVLPKHSLLYEKFELLNELNSIQLRSKAEPANRKYRLDEDVKAWTIENIFKQFKTVTHARFLEELKKYPKYCELDLEHKQIFGTQKENAFVSSLSSHINFSSYIQLFGEETVEGIIYDLTIFNEGSIVEQKLKERIPTISDDLIKNLRKIKLSGWGRLSEKLLDGITLSNGLTVIQTMLKESKNFMELQVDTDLKKIIKAANGKTIVKKIKYEDIKALSGSPAIKRAIWRAVKIVEELTGIFGEPQHIMLEVAREEQASRRQKSNKELYELLTKEFKGQEDKLFASKFKNEPEARFRSDKFWLYVTQMGKCMYSGEELEITNLDQYDIDHIYPQSFTMDNSYDNRVLVKKHMNMRKGNLKTPLEVIPTNQKFARIKEWERLHELKLITKKKLDRLMKQSITEQDKQGFINRQLVETRQIIINVKDLLEERFSDTKIHLVKAKIVSKFRKSLELPKIREYNNKHHAIDAILTALLIQFIENEYGSNIFNFKFGANDHLKRITIEAQASKEFFAFKAFKEQIMKLNSGSKEASAVQYIREIYYDIPWQTTKLQGASDGMFYKQTIFSPREKQAKYTSNKADRFVHAEVKKLKSLCIKYTFEKKGQRVTQLKIVDMNVIDSYQLVDLEKNELAKAIICRNVKEEVIEAEILLELHKYQKVIWNNHPFYFISSDELHNAKQWEIPKILMDQLTNEKIAELEVEQLRLLMTEIATNFFEQYTIYDNATFRTKVERYIENELINYESFKVCLNELFKSAAANAIRSDKFGSRLAKSIKPEESKVIYESITGLKYRKPRGMSVEKKKAEVLQ